MKASPHGISGVEDLIAADEFCERLRAAWKTDRPIRIEDLLAEAPETLRDLLLEDLIAEEADLRARSGEQPEFRDYEGRFRDRLQAAFRGFRHFDPHAPPPRDLSQVSTGAMPREELAGSDALASRWTAPDDAVESARQIAPANDEPLPTRIGRYTILGLLGEGGFGRVYLAEDSHLRRRVAIKVPSTALFTSGKSVEAFLDEARAAASLKHPGLVTVHDVQQEQGRPFIVQEYIDGANLQQWMPGTPASYPRIVSMLIDIAEAVGFLHQQALVHRDVKPRNILIDRHGHAHLADFGLVVHESTQWRRAGEVVGTCAYMSPEQLRGETHLLDGRTDLWSLGVICYELLAGRHPFPAADHHELRDKIAHWRLDLRASCARTFRRNWSGSV